MLSGQDVPRPIIDIREAGFPDYVLKAWDREGFKHPTPIQAAGTTLLCCLLSFSRLSPH